jgi:hypothetical protein
MKNKNRFGPINEIARYIENTEQSIPIQTIQDYDSNLESYLEYLETMLTESLPISHQLDFLNIYAKIKGCNNIDYVLDIRNINKSWIIDFRYPRIYLKVGKEHFKLPENITPGEWNKVNSLKFIIN